MPLGAGRTLSQPPPGLSLKAQETAPTSRMVPGSQLAGRSPPLVLPRKAWPRRRQASGHPLTAGPHVGHPISQPEFPSGEPSGAAPGRAAGRGGVRGLASWQQGGAQALRGPAGLGSAFLGQAKLSRQGRAALLAGAEAPNCTSRVPAISAAGGEAGAGARRSSAGPAPPTPCQTGLDHPTSPVPRRPRSGCQARGSWAAVPAAPAAAARGGCYRSRRTSCPPPPPQSLRDRKPLRLAPGGLRWPPGLFQTGLVARPSILLVRWPSRPGALPLNPKPCSRSSETFLYYHRISTAPPQQLERRGAEPPLWPSRTPARALQLGAWCQEELPTVVCRDRGEKMGL